MFRQRRPTPFPFPPKRRTSPEGRPQQMWECLRSTRVTFNSINAEIPSNFSQDLGESPPQRMLLQKVANLLGVVMSPAGQDWPVLGLKTSVALRNTSLHPPATINPLVGFSAFMIFERFRANIDKMSCGRSVKLIN